MAMKMNATEKANDSTIRAFNAQIEKAYKTLGANNTVTQNLINKARSVYGANNMKEMNRAGNNIPQKVRTRATVSNNTSAKALYRATHYTSGTRKGQYKSMYDANIIYAIANETGAPVTTNGEFFADLDSAINDAKQNNDTTLYGMIKNGFSILYKNRNTETIKRELFRTCKDIRTIYYATDTGVIISNVYDNLNQLLKDLYARNYTPVYMSIHNDFKICVDTFNDNTDETSFEPIEHLELKIYDALLKE